MHIMRKVFEKTVLLLEKKISKSNLKRLYYITAAVSVLHVRAVYNISLSLFDSILFAIEVAVLLVYIRDLRIGGFDFI